MLLWIATGSNLVAYVLLQMLLTVGYGPTVWHLFKEKRNTEPFDVWGVSLVIAALAIVPPFFVQPHDGFAIAYAVRATLSVAIILGVMWYFHRREVSLNRPR